MIVFLFGLIEITDVSGCIVENATICNNAQHVCSILFKCTFFFLHTVQIDSILEMDLHQRRVL